MPGAPLSRTNEALLTGAGMVQDFSPVKHVCAHFNAFHVYAADPTRPPVEANHYCSEINDDVRQCLLYDSTGPHARLIGVEYMVSAKLFATLPPDEKKLWHSHVYEAKSGMLIMPKPASLATGGAVSLLPDALWEKAERAEMEQVVHFYGKIYHFWQIDRGDPLPFGPPQLMMSYTADGQMDFDKHVAARDARFGVDYRRKREQRKDIAEPDIDPLADQVWKKDLGDS